MEVEREARIFFCIKNSLEMQRIRWENSYYYVYRNYR